MSTARKLNLVSIDDYLDGELISPIKHEYFGGKVSATVGARNVHNLIATNTTSAVHGRPCCVYNSDTKFRLLQAIPVRFYYPDASVICRPNPPTHSFQDEPVVLFEVLSEGTRRIDEGEKKQAYLAILSLSVYVLIEQETATVVAYRRTASGFDREVYQGLDAVLPLDEIGIELPLAEIYEMVEFTAEVEEDGGN